MSYPGGKAGAGVTQAIINQMPPHRVYIEPFLGGGAVMRAKRPALVNVGLDLNLRPLRSFLGSAIVGSGGGAARSSWPRRIRRWDPASFDLASVDVDGLRFSFLNGCGIDFLKRTAVGSDALVYCDPPYLHSTRGRSDLYGQFELQDSDHVKLLGVLRGLPCYVLLSGYWSKLYSSTLRDWRTVRYQTTNRRGQKVTEWLWCNFPEPSGLHDDRFLGSNFRERERIKRKKARWVKRLASMPVLERQALYAALSSTMERA